VRAHLAEAAARLDAPEPGPFAEAVRAAVRETLRRLHDVEGAGPPESVARSLETGGLSHELAGRVQSVLRACDSRRYGSVPEDSQADRRRLIAEATAVCRALARTAHRRTG
jgi:hypothetical protein